jgi:hypothetical protein
VTTTSSYKSPYALPRPKSLRAGDTNLFGVKLDQSVTKAQSKLLSKYGIYSPTHPINGAIRGTPKEIFARRVMYCPIAEEIYPYLASEACERFHTPEVIEAFKSSKQWSYIKNKARAAGAESQVYRAGAKTTVLSPRDLVAIIGGEIEFVNIEGFDVHLDGSAIRLLMNGWREEINYDASLTLFELSLWWNKIKPDHFYVENGMDIVGEIANVYGIPSEHRGGLFSLAGPQSDHNYSESSRNFRFARVNRERLFWMFVLYDTDPPVSQAKTHGSYYLKMVDEKLGAEAVVSILHRRLTPSQLVVLADSGLEDLDSAAALVKVGFTDGEAMRKAVDEGVDGSLLVDFFSSSKHD